MSVGHYYCASPGIRLLTEVDRIIRCCSLDWDEIKRYARELKIEKRMYIAMSIIRKVLRTPCEPEGMLSLNEKNEKKKMDNLIYCLCKNGKDSYELQEPIGTIKRLYIDIYSEPGNAVYATLMKIRFAVCWVLLPRYNELGSFND